jgi:hypothetical protein
MSNYGTGLDASVMFGQESSFNTFATPTRALPLTSDTVSRSKKTITSAGLRGGLAQSQLAAQRRVSTREAKGNVILDVQNQSMGVLLNNCLGSASSATSGAAYTWTHTLAGLKGKSLTAQFGRPSADGTVNPFTYTGGKVTDWEMSLGTDSLLALNCGFDFADELTTANTPAISGITQTGVAGAVTYYYRVSAIVGGVEQPAGLEVSTALSNATLSGSNYNVVTFSTVTGASGYNVYRSTAAGAELKLAAGTNIAGPTFQDQSNTVGVGSPLNPATLTAPTYATTMAPFSFTDVSTLTLAGSSVAAVKKISIKGANPIKGDRWYLGSAGVKAEQVTNGWRAVTGTMEAEFTSLSALYAAYAADTQLAFVFKATSPTLIPTTVVPYSFRVDIPALFLDGDTPNITGPDILTMSIPFVGLYDGTNSPITVTQVTSDTTL